MFSIITLLLLLAPLQAAPASPPASKAQSVVSGTFDVSVTPQTGDDGPVGVLGLAKTYHGALEAKAIGRMLGGGSPDTGTASYVALERVDGTLAGRKGSFILQQNGWMHDGRQVMQVSIAPGSGTGELAGLTGTMQIVIKGSQHSYVLTYRLPR